MTDTLPANPSPDVNITRSAKPNISVAQFGDGYSQRVGIGLNTVALSMVLTYSYLITAEKNIIEGFILAHQKGEAFFWKMPDESTPRKWFIEQWDITYVKYGIYNVSIQIKEVFDI